MPTRNSQTQRLLLLGFGGLLLLLAFTGLNALSVLGRIQAQNESIRRDYFNRERVLDQLRSDIYLSGTYVRDWLLEQDSSLAEVHRREFEDSKVRIERNLSAYGRLVQAEERTPFEQFRQQVQDYFELLRPPFEWTAEQRRRNGYSFTKNFLLPRRMIVVGLADQVGRVIERQMETGNREVSLLFASFRRSIVVLLILAMICGTLFAAGATSRILRLERLSALRFAEVEDARKALRELSTRLIAVQESERQALSRELHDEVGQSLSALLLGISNVSAVISGDGNVDARSRLQELRRLAERMVAVVRDMSLLLRPSMLDDLGLIPALRWQAREVSRTKGLSVVVNAGDVSEDIPDQHKTCIYRLVQEALHNIARHARAKTVNITLKQDAERLLLTISDDGQGFSPEREKGMGLLGMQERVNHLHGSFAIESAPGSGTSLRAELPLLRKAASLLV